MLQTKNREIKKIPSKTKFSDKVSSRTLVSNSDHVQATRKKKDQAPHMLAQENAFDVPNEVFGVHHKTSKSQSKQRHSSHTNRIVQ